MSCVKCGQVHVTHTGKPACTGHISTGSPGQDKPDAGRACRNPPMRGQKICQKHGGKAAQNRAAAKTRQAEAKAEKVLRRFGEPIDTTPTEALLDAVRWTAGYVAWLREKVAAVSCDEKLIWGLTRRKIGGEDNGTTHEAKPNAWLELLGTWHDRLVKICAEAIKAGIEERRVRLAESQGQLVADVIKAILADLKLTPAQQAKAGEVVPFRLRELAG